MFLSALPFLLAMSGQAVAPPQQAPPPQTAPAAAVQRPATPAAPRKIYNDTADARAAIAAAVASAAEDGIRVLVNWGANDNARCASFGAAQRDPAFGVKMSDEYKVVYVDVGQGDKNADLLQSYGVKFAADALPLLTVLDVKGKVVAQASGTALAAADPLKLDGGKTGAFLKQHQAAPPPPAQPQLNAAFAEARRGDKQVFVWFAAPW